MLKAVIYAGGAAGVEEVAAPEAIENWVAVKVRVAPMCTEYKAYKAGGENRRANRRIV